MPFEQSGRPYSYATLGDVLGYLPGASFGATTKPNASQVETALELCSNELDAVLDRFDYATPVPTTATAAFGMVRAWTTLGGAYRAALAMPQGKNSQHAESYGKEWTAVLTSLEAGKRQLPDAPRNSRARSATRHEGEAEPTFSRSEVMTNL